MSLEMGRESVGCVFLDVVGTTFYFTTSLEVHSALFGETSSKGECNIEEPFICVVSLHC